MIDKNLLGVYMGSLPTIYWEWIFNYFYNNNYDYIWIKTWETVLFYLLIAIIRHHVILTAQII